MSYVFVYLPVEDLQCPIFREIMKEPVIAADGHTYEKESLKEWFSKGRKTSPLTNKNLPHTSFVENHFAKKIIQETRKVFYDQGKGINNEFKLNSETFFKENEEIVQKFSQINLHELQDSDDLIQNYQKQIQLLKISKEDIEFNYSTKLKLSEENYKTLLDEIIQLNKINFNLKEELELNYSIKVAELEETIKELKIQIDQINLYYESSKDER